MEPLNPPVPGTTISQDIRDISIDKPIRDGDSCGAQVLLTSEGLIAKFFDPLCYDFENKDRYEKANVTASADRDYVAETAAYLAPHTTSFMDGGCAYHYERRDEISGSTHDSNRARSRYETTGHEAREPSARGEGKYHDL
jgi:hypothetical protein